MKNRILLGTILALLLIGSVSFATEDADKARLLKEYDKIQKEREKEAERLAKEQAKEAERLAKEQAEEAERLAKEEKEQAEAEAVEVKEVVTESENTVETVENAEIVEVAEAPVPEKVDKKMTDSEKMDVEVQRIKKRILEINDKIENHNKTNEMIDNLEKNIGELEKRVNY